MFSTFQFGFTTPNFSNKKENINVNVSNRHDYLNDEIDSIQKSLVSKRNELKILKQNQQTNENNEQINLLKTEIFDLKQRQTLCKFYTFYTIM